MRLWANVSFTSLSFSLAGGRCAVRTRGAEGAGGVSGRLCYPVLSLALSALMLRLLSVPMELYNFVWFHSRVSDDLGASYFVQELCAYATVFSIFSLNAEHYLALRARHLLTLHMTRRLLSLAWAASLVLGLSLPMAITMGQKKELEVVGGGAGACRACVLCAVTCPHAPGFHPGKREGAQTA